MRRWLLLPVALAALAAACAGAATTPSGLQGTVMRGPTSPVCRTGVPCSKPAANVVIVFSQAGHADVTVRTDARGRYKIRLPAGTYGVHTARRNGVSIQPRRALVKTRVMRRVDLAIDTGIR